MTSPPELLLRGVSRPRVELRPLAVGTLGGFAAEVGERAGIHLEPWQRDGLDMLLSTREDGKWACYEYAELCSRRNGKTAMMLVRALFGFLLLNESPILWTAQEVKTSMRAWRDFRKMLWQLGERINDNLVDLGDGVLVRINASNGKEGFERVDTGQELKMVARSKDSGRGFDADFVVIDEAYDFTAEQQDALAPTQMARPNAQITYASSPPLNGRASESLYRLRNRAEAGRGAKLGWRDWGRGEYLDDVLAMPDRERCDFLDDPHVWASANPALGGGRVTLETIGNLREAMSDLGFAREVLGLWPRQVAGGAGWEVLSEQAWSARGAEGKLVRPTSGLAFALDASWPDGSMGSIGLAGALGDELVVQVIEHRPGTGWMVDRAVELHERWPDAAVVLDRRGPIGHLARELEDAGVPLVAPSSGDVAHAFGRIVAAVTGDAPNLRHGRQPELDAAVKAAGTRSLGDGRMWARQHADGADISPLTAVTLAVGEAARPVEESSPPRGVPAATGAGPETADLMNIGF